MTEASIFEILVQLFAIIMVNLMLSGDNAVVIAMACRNLPEKHQQKAIIFGTGGAVILRILLTTVAAYLLTIPFLQFAGGVLLIWIAVKLLLDSSDDDEIAAGDSFTAAIKTIIVADLIMSLDNTLAIAALAQGNTWLLVAGLIMSVPIVIFGSTILIKFMEKFPIILYIGAGLIAWAAGFMIRDDGIVGSYFVFLGPNWMLPFLITAGTITFGYFWNKRLVSVSEDE